MTSTARSLTLLAPCYNERDNVALLHQRLTAVVAGLPDLACELVFIDNASTDGTQDELRKLVAQTERQPAGGLAGKGHFKSAQFWSRPFTLSRTVGGER